MPWHAGHAAAKRIGRTVTGSQHTFVDAGTETCRHLCICADDFGTSPGINAAILDLAERGKICAASGMVRRSAWALGAGELRRLDPVHFDVGLHLDFSRPRREGGSNCSSSRLTDRGCPGLLQPGFVRCEIKDQLACFEDALGRRPAFVDGHRHVHQLPVVRDALIEEGIDRYGAALPWIRSAVPRVALGRAARKADLIFALGGTQLVELAFRHGIPPGSGLPGAYDFAGSVEAYRQRLGQWLRNARSGDVLMCHPGLGGAIPDPIDIARRNEYAVLGSIEFPVQCAEGEIFLTPLSRQSHPMMAMPIGVP